MRISSKARKDLSRRKALTIKWCPGGDSNPYDQRPTDFKSVASAIPPPGLFQFPCLAALMSRSWAGGQGVAPEICVRRNIR